MSRATWEWIAIIIGLAAVGFGLSIGIALSSQPQPVEEIVLESQMTFEERFATRTPEEIYLVKQLEERGWEYISLPIRWSMLPRDWSTEHEDDEEDDEIGLFYRVSKYVLSEGQPVAYYYITFEHNLDVEITLVDRPADGRVDKIEVGEHDTGVPGGYFQGPRSWFEEYLYSTLGRGFGTCRASFERPPDPLDNTFTKLQALFREADELISYLK